LLIAIKVLLLTESLLYGTIRVHCSTTVLSLIDWYHFACLYAIKENVHNYKIWRSRR